MRKPMYFSTKCIEFELRFWWTNIFAFFDTLKFTYTLTYTPRGVRDIPQVDCLPGNILLS